VHYWARIAERYQIDLSVVSEQVDPTFPFMTLDWDGRIRMDPSSPYAMRRLVGLKDKYDIAFSCDTDHDRHGIVAPSSGLMPPNHFLAVAIDYLFRHRPGWSAAAAVGKTVVSSAMIDRVAARLGRRLYEVPVGFKWFADGLFDGSLGFGGEESAGASFLRRDGTVWTTDKDGIAAALLAGEITARTGRDPGLHYRDLARELGAMAADRVDAPATVEQKKRLGKLSPAELKIAELAGDPIREVLSHAPGNGAGERAVSRDSGQLEPQARPLDGGAAVHHHRAARLANPAGGHLVDHAELEPHRACLCVQRLVRDLARPARVHEDVDDVHLERDVGQRRVAGLAVHGLGARVHRDDPLAHALQEPRHAVRGPEGVVREPDHGPSAGLGQQAPDLVIHAARMP